MNKSPSPRSELVNPDEMRRKAHELDDAVDIYERFEDEELYNQEELPSEVEGYIRELDEESLEGGISPGIALANNIKHMTKDLQNDIDRYIEQYGPQGQQRDMDEIMDETEPARAATRRAWRLGYDASKLSGETDNVEEAYTVPKEMSLFRLLFNETEKPVIEYHHE